MSNDWQRLPIDKASSGYVAQVALSAPQAVQREPEIPLPLSVPRIAFHQAAHDSQRLVVARRSSVQIAGLQFGIAQLVQRDVYIPQPKGIARIAFG